MTWPLMLRSTHDAALDEARKQCDREVLAIHLRESEIARVGEATLVARHATEIDAIEARHATERRSLAETIAERGLQIATIKAEREHYQRLSVTANTRAATAESRYHTMSERFVALVEKIATPVPALTMPERKRDDLTEAIALRAGADVSLRRHLGAWAQQQRREKVEETVIINNILHWKGDEDDAA